MIQRDFFQRKINTRPNVRDIDYRLEKIYFRLRRSRGIR